MKIFTNEITLEEENENVGFWKPLELNIDEQYEYVPKGTIFKICSNLLYYGIAYPILKILTKVVYDLKIEGKENIINLKEGAITVSNHVLVLDCAMVGLACGMKKIHYTTQEESFKIPFVRKLIKLLRAIPIPNGIDNKKHFKKAIDKILQEGNIVHVYPEASLSPYCEKIRNFKDGAFSFAISNKVPIVPMVFKFREPKGIRKLFKQKKDVTLIVLDPINFDSDNNSKKQSIEELKNKVCQKMQDAMK